MCCLTSAESLVVTAFASHPEGIAFCLVEKDMARTVLVGQLNSSAVALATATPNAEIWRWTFALCTSVFGKLGAATDRCPSRGIWGWWRRLLGIAAFVQWSWWRLHSDLKRANTDKCFQQKSAHDQDGWSSLFANHFFRLFNYKLFWGN